MGVACREMGLINEAIEQFNMALETGQKPFDAAQLLGLCFLEVGRPQEARRSFQDGLKMEGVPKAKIMEVELALRHMEEKEEENPRGFAKRNNDEQQRLNESAGLQNRKRQLPTSGDSLISPRQT